MARLLGTDPALLAGHLILTATGPAMLAGLDSEQFAEMAAAFTAMLDERILPQIELDAQVDLGDRPSRVKAPTLVLASADDQIIPARHQRELATAISQSRYPEVPGGHGLPFEDPDRFFAIITEFVDSQQATTAARAPA